jgi:hypothetical protein
MSNPTYQTTLTLNEEDNRMREVLNDKMITVIDTWRRGAVELVQELEREDSND